MPSRRRSTDRAMAIAGFFNSCASPAASLPSVARRSRCVVSDSPSRVSRAGSPMSALGEKPVGELDGDGSLADGGRDPLHRLMPHVAGAEDAGDVRLEQVRIAVERPAARPTVLLLEIGASENEAVLVPLNNSGDPIRARLGADEREERRHLHLALLA